MTLSNYVTVNISVQSAQPTAAGFGTPLILANRPAASSSIKTTDITTYTSLGGVAEDYNSDEFVYLAAQKMFSAETAPTSIKAVVLPTPSTYQNMTINLDSIASGSAITGSLISNAGSGSVVLADPGAATSDTAKNLADAIGAFSGVSASSDVNEVTVVAGTEGDMWHFTCDLDAIKIYDSTADWGYDDHLDEVLSRDSDFYFVVCDNNSAKNIDKVARWAAANDKFAVFAPQFAGIASGDWDGDLFTATADYTSLLANDNAALLFTKDSRREAKDAAWVGLQSTTDPGSSTWAFKSLNATGTDDWTSTQEALIIGDTVGGNYYITQNGVNITYPGQASSGEYIDVTRGISWLKARMAERIFGIMTNNPKIPYTNKGMQTILAEVLGQLKQAENRGLIDAGFTASIPAVADQAVADRATRVVRDVTFTATLQGAVHKVIINGTVSV